MLITLQSNNDADASDFSNYFKETVQILPDSEVGFISLAYQFTNDGGGDRESQVILVNIEELGIKSICKDGGVQKTIGIVPYGEISQDATKVEGEFYYENYNLIYHSLENKQIANHNQLRVRLTDGVGNPLVQLAHPTILTIDLRPRAR